MEESASLTRVLVVDDDDDHLLMLAVLLEAVGYEVLTAASCATGRAILATERVDALIADYSLGDGTALDLVRGLGEQRPRVSLVLSGFDADEDIDNSLAAGFDAHLVKPTAIDLLRDTLAAALRRPSGMRLAPAAQLGLVEVAADGTDDLSRRKR